MNIPTAGAPTLTETQRQVFDHLILGLTNLEIAAAMRRSEKTVKQHVTEILKKHRCGNRARLIANYYRRLLESASPRAEIKEVSE